MPTIRPADPSAEVDALDADAIRAGLAAGPAALLHELTVLAEADSTNDVLLRLPPAGQHAHAVLADRQSRGRGRRERAWHSPAGGNIYLSLGWVFGRQPPALSTLPLAVAVCVARALDTVGLSGHAIKWPNDIRVGGAKLAGVLVESQAAGTGPVRAVAGVGLNLRMPATNTGAEGPPIDRPWTDLASCLPAGTAPSRNRLAATLLGCLLPGMEAFEADGFSSFVEDWRRLDLLKGRRVRVEDGQGLRAGVALGIDDSGGLLVDFAGGRRQVVHAAEVSILDG